VANSSLAILFPVFADGTEGAAKRNEECVVTICHELADEVIPILMGHDLVVTLHEETGQTNSFILRNRSAKIQASMVKL